MNFDMSGFKPLNLAQLYQSADAAVGQAMQTNLLMMQASRMKQEYHEEDQLRELAKTSTVTGPDGQPNFDLKTFTKGAYSVNPMKAIGFEKTAREAEKAGMEKEKLQGEIDEKRMKGAADRLKAVNEATTVPFLKYKELTEKGIPDADARKQVQPMYQSAVQSLVTSGLFNEEQLGKFNIKPQFDPADAEAGMRHVLGAKDSLAQYWNEKNYGQKERHHADSIRVQIQGQNITLRGQNLTDARSREQLALSGIEIKENEDRTYSAIDKKTNTASPVLDQSGKPMMSPKGQGTEGERQASGFATRMVASENIFKEIAASAQKPGMMESMGKAVPLAGEVIANNLRGDDRQRALQAQRDWVRAKLRKESGAVIGPKEMEDEIQTYFPQIGDGKDAILQKRAARERANDGMVQNAGRAYKAPPPPAAPPGREEAGKITAAPVKVATVDDYNKVKDGDPYIDPNGVRRIKGQRGEGQ